MKETEALETKIRDLRENIAWMDLVLANIDQGILVLDTSWRIIYANDWVADLMGIDRILILGKKFTELSLKPEEKSVLRISKMGLQSVAQLNGLYSITRRKWATKISVNARFVPELNQALCILSNVSDDVLTESVMRQFYKEVMLMRQEIAVLKSKNAKE